MATIPRKVQTACCRPPRRRGAPTPAAFTCCPSCTPTCPVGPTPGNFCTDFPGAAGAGACVATVFPCAAIAPWGLLAITGANETFSGVAGQITLNYNGGAHGVQDVITVRTGLGGAGAPQINPVTEAFCFCGVLAQSAPLVTATNTGSDFGLLLSGTDYLLVSTYRVVGGAQATYIVKSSKAGVETVFNTGVPVNGTIHKFQVCGAGIGGTPLNLTVSIDNGPPVDTGIVTAAQVPTGLNEPFLGITVAAGVQLPFNLKVNSTCFGGCQVPD